MKKAIISFLSAIVCIYILIGCSDKPSDNIAGEESQQQLEIKSEDLPIPTIKAEHKETIDLASEFKGINGCAIFFDSLNNTYSFYNEDMCRKEVSPYSTFKIISTMMGLENKIIVDDTSEMSYTGIQYPLAEWNSSLTLQEAFRSSCIWYFRQVIDEIGADEMEKELKALDYGNCDISEWNGNNTNPSKELNGFWINSSLKISPLNQVEVLKEIFEDNSSYDTKSKDILKKIMLVGESAGQDVYGKTGTGPNGEAWFVGFANKSEVATYFAVYLDDENESVSGNTAKEITMNILNQ